MTLFGAEDGATFSEDRTYRYTLTRWWNPDSPQIAWIMLNPSIADAARNDPTLRRIIDFSKRWGYGGLVVVNLFALIATDPGALPLHPDPIGPANDAAIFGAIAGLTAIAAWGASVPSTYQQRPKAIRAQLAQRRTPLYHLGLTKDGHPRHPLYLPADTAPTLWTTP